jgi:segregation and condensation protein B
VTREELAGAVEAVLFVSGEPAPVDRVRQSLSCTSEELDRALDDLTGILANRGLRLQRGQDGLQLVSAPEFSAPVERFLGIQSTSKPSAAALETLAIVAYRQPVSRAQIEEVRGVNCERVLRALVAQGLVQDVGRSSALGRPVLYGTTDEFLQRFGLAAIENMPELPDEATESTT